MTENKIEIVYEAIADKIDNLGEEKAKLFLAKLSLLLANKIEDTSFVLNAKDTNEDHMEVKYNFHHMLGSSQGFIRASCVFTNGAKGRIMRHADLSK